MSCYASWETARNLTEEALRLSQKNHAKAIERRLMLLLGKILGMSGAYEPNKGAEIILKGIEILKELGARAFYSLRYLFLGAIYLNAGRVQTAYENLLKAEGLFREMGMDYWLGKAQESLAEM